MMIIDTPRPTHEAARQKLQADIDQYLRAGGRIVRVGTTYSEVYRNPWKDKSKRGYNKRQVVKVGTETN